MQSSFKSRNFIVASVSAHELLKFECNWMSLSHAKKKKKRHSWLLCSSAAIGIKTLALCKHTSQVTAPVLFLLLHRCLYGGGSAISEFWSRNCQYEERRNNCCALVLYLCIAYMSDCMSSSSLTLQVIWFLVGFFLSTCRHKTEQGASITTMQQSIDLDFLDFSHSCNTDSAGAAFYGFGWSWMWRLLKLHKSKTSLQFGCCLHL